MSFKSLHPNNATPYELAVERGTDFADDVYASVHLIAGLKFQRPLIPTVAPWLLYEEGLSDIAVLFDAPEEALDAGMEWTRQHGRPSALRVAYVWLDYDTITIEDDKCRRRNWNLGQVALGELPGDDEVERLNWAEYLSVRSLPARSELFRGHHGYDVRACEAGYQRFSRSIFSDSSGERLDGGAVKWSHGRVHSVSATLTYAERTALGVNYENGNTLIWDDFPWSAPGVSWDGVSDAVAFKAYMLMRKSAYVGFYKANGDAIGYRRVGKAKADVTANVVVGAGLAAVTFRVQTAFGDGDMQDCAHVAMVFDAMNNNAAKPGKQWLSADEIAFPDGVSQVDRTVGMTALVFSFGHTIRERVTLTLTV